MMHPSEDPETGQAMSAPYPPVPDATPGPLPMPMSIPLYPPQPPPYLPWPSPIPPFPSTSPDTMPTPHPMPDGLSLPELELFTFLEVNLGLQHPQIQLIMSVCLIEVEHLMFLDHGTIISLE